MIDFAISCFVGLCTVISCLLNKPDISFSLTVVTITGMLYYICCILTNIKNELKKGK